MIVIRNTIATLVILLASISGVLAQLSSNQIKYQVTYDANTQLYSVWVVPQYATPNANNSSVDEHGSTAQVTLKVPRNFAPQNITSIKGSWSSSPFKMDASSFPGTDPNYAFYTFGKDPADTNYGAFSSGTPIKLFTFQGSICADNVGILSPTDSFIGIADGYGYGVACSFNSLSGQPKSGNVVILEQFVDKLAPDATAMPMSPSTPTATPTTICVGQTVSVATTGATGASYAWTVTPLATAGITPSTTSTLVMNPTAAGTYNISVTQLVGGCPSVASAPTTVSVNALPTSPVPTSTTVSNTCPASTADLTSVQPTLPIGQTYEWHTVSSNPTVSNIVATPTSVSSGTYYLYVKNTTTGCFSVSSSGVTVNISGCCPVISVGQTGNTNSCGGSDGMVRIDGLTANINYMVSYVKGASTITVPVNANMLGQATIAGLSAGSYTNLKLTSPCISNAVSFNLNEPNAPSAPSVPTATPSTACMGATISLSTTGAGSSTYMWSVSPTGGGLVNSTTNTATMTPTLPGTYTVSVKQIAGGCTSPAVVTTVTITALPTTPNAAIVSSLNPTTCAGSNGSINLTGYTPNNSYTISYTKNGINVTTNIVSNAAGTLIINSLGAGSYSNFTIKDNISSCSSGIYTGVVTLSDPTSPIAPSTIVVSPSASVCLGSPVSLSTTGVSGASYTWVATPTGNGLAASTTNTATMTPTSSGTYTVSVTQTVAGCTSAATTANVVVNSLPTTPSASNIASSNPTSCAGANGSLSLLGYTPNVTYTINYTKNGVATSTTIVSDGSGRLIVNNLTAGSYSNISVKENTANCTSGLYAGSITLTDPTTPVAPSTPVFNANATCIGSPISLSTTGISGASYVWFASPSAGAGLTNNNLDNTTMTPSATGVYTISVTQTVAGCTSPAATVNITVNALPTSPSSGTMSSTNPSTCGGSDGIISLAGYTLNKSYTINYAKNGVSTTVNSIADATGKLVINSLTIGTYSNISVKDNLSNCSSGVYAGNIILSSPTSPNAPNIPTINPSTACLGTPISLSTNGASGASYVWSISPSTGAGLSNSTTNTATMTPTSSGTYTVSVTQTVAGCTSAAATANVVVNSLPTTPSASNIASSNPTSCAGANGSVSLLGYTPNATYTINYTKNGVATSTTIVSDGSGRLIVNNLTAGSYSNISVKENTANCTSGLYAGSITLTDPTTPNAPGNIVTTPSSACMGSPVSLSTIGISGASYVWSASPSAGAGLSNSTTNTAAMNPTLAGTYTISVTQTSNGCTSPATNVTVIVNALPKSLTPNDITTINPSCGSLNGSIVITGLNSNTTYTVTYLENGVSKSSVIASDITGKGVISNLGAATYTSLSLTLNGCISATPLTTILTLACNQPPVIVGEPIITETGKPTTQCMLIKDPQPADTHTYTLCNTPSGGTLLGAIDNTTHQLCLTYTPNSSFVGSDVACVIVCDTKGACDTLKVPIMVLPKSTPSNTQQAPTVVPTLLNTTKGTAISTCLPIQDPNTADTHTYSICKNPANGAATVSVNNATHQLCITYTPNATYVGKDSVCITVCDQTNLCTNVTIALSVIDVKSPIIPQPPVVVLPPLVTDPNTPVTVCGTINDPNIGDTHTATPCNIPNSGTINPSIDNNTHQICITYTPKNGFIGSDKVCLNICDQTGNCTQVEVPILVKTPNNESPVIIGMPIVVPQDGSNQVCMKISDPNANDTHTVTSCNTPVNGTTNLSVNNTTHEVCVTYTAKPGKTGADEVCIIVCDTKGACDTLRVPVIILPTLPPTTPPTAPVVIPARIITPSNTSVTLCVPVRDANVGDTFSATLCNTSPNGTASTTVNNGKLCVTYISKPNYVGKDSVCVTVCDQTGLCTKAVFPVSVIALPQPPNVPQPPVVVLPPVITDPNIPITVCGTINDPNTGDIHNASLCNIPSSGTVITTINNTTHGICLTYTPKQGFVGSDKVCINVCDQTGACTQLEIPIYVNKTKVSVSVKAYLQGALFGVYMPDDLMRDDLRSNGYLPTASPYPALGLSGVSNNNTTTGGVFLVTGKDAIVDWVFVELRSSTDPTVVVDSRSALIQRDGDIVDTDGVSPIVFNQALTGNYYIAVRHRNHLGIMSKTALSLSNTPLTIDFRSTSTPTYSFDVTNPVNVPQVNVQQGNAMWAGNALLDKNIIYQGTDNDVNVIYQQVLHATGNTLGFLNYKLKGYYVSDINMNGISQLQGTDNDVEYIYQNVIQNHVGNVLKQNFFKIKEQLP
jgi:large repetitive protein